MLSGADLSQGWSEQRSAGNDTKLTARGVLRSYLRCYRAVRDDNLGEMRVRAEGAQPRGIRNMRDGS